MKIASPWRLRLAVIASWAWTRSLLIASILPRQHSLIKIVVIYMRVTGSQAFFGQATTLIAVLFLGGVQLISLGILGEYIGRLYDEAKGRPLYIVREGPEEVERLKVES